MQGNEDREVLSVKANSSYKMLNDKLNLLRNKKNSLADLLEFYT